MSPPRTDSGQVTVFVVVFITALLFVAGLVIDGGYVLTAKRDAINIAEHAARAGAQELSVETLRATGRHILDPQRAATAARDYLSTVGYDATVAVADDRITVTVTVHRRPIILGIAGLGDFTITGKATARNVRGVTEADS